MRKRRAYSINVKTTPLKVAREYAEKEFEKKGKSLDEVLPNFDKNYMMLQKRLKGALEIPRISMPVIEPSDMALFNKRLNSGSVDVFAPYAKGKLHTPSSLSKDEGEEWVELGFQDGNKGDDVVRGKLGGFPVGKMKPTQSQIWFDKIVKLILQYGPAKSGSPILSQTVIVSGDNYILDGHHRYAQAMIADQGLKMRALKIPLPIDLLLKIGKTYGESIGNSAKASIVDENREKLAESLVKMATALMAKPDAEKLLKSAFGGDFQKAKIVGDSKYSVAVGTRKGKWYAVETSGNSPQVWEARSAKALSQMVEDDTGVKTAKKVEAKSASDGLDKMSGELFKMKKAIIDLDYTDEERDSREVDKHFVELVKLVDKAAGRASTLAGVLRKVSRKASEKTAAAWAVDMVKEIEDSISELEYEVGQSLDSQDPRSWNRASGYINKIELNLGALKRLLDKADI